MTISTTDHLWSEVSFPGVEGHTLHGRWFEPAGERRGVVIVVPAMATESAFYTTFASWLRDRGFAVLTFDYRGYGISLDGHLRDVEADVVDWAHDARDALAYALERADGAPLTWIGHSLGGQVLPFADHARVDRGLTIAAGVGYWRLNSPGVRRIAPLLWKVVAPAAIAVAGYYPGTTIRMLGDLPAGVMRQWAAWCMHPDYLLGELPEMRERYAAVRTPLASLSFTDDELMSRESIAALDGLYTGVDQTHLRFTPEQLDVDGIGHFGFFRRNRVDLWDELVLPHLAV